MHNKDKTTFLYLYTGTTCAKIWLLRKKSNIFCVKICWLLELSNLLKGKKVIYLAYFVGLLFVGKQWWRWCACCVWMFNQLVQIAKPLLAMDCPWQNIIVAYASFLTMKGNTAQICILVPYAVFGLCLCSLCTILT